MHKKLSLASFLIPVLFAPAYCLSAGVPGEVIPEESSQTNKPNDFSNPDCMSSTGKNICVMVEYFGSKMQAKKEKCDGINDCISDVSFEHKTLTLNQWNPISKEIIAKDAEDMNVSVSTIITQQNIMSRAELCKSAIGAWVKQGVIVKVNYLYSDNSLMSSLKLDSCP